MFTVCPKCTLTLAVTANDLRLGQGYVRCGRCSNVFNALLKLSDTPTEGDAVIQLAQADPASASQIRRALSSAMAESPVPPRPAPGRAPTPPPGPAPAPAPARSPASGAAAARAPAAPAHAAAPAAAPPAAPPSVPSSAAPPASAPSAAAPRMAASARPPNPANPVTPVTPATPATPSRPFASPGSAPAGSAPRSAPPAISGADARSAPGGARPVPATARTGAQAPRSPVRESGASPGAEPEADTDAIDQFELVLKNLGLNLDDDEPLLDAQPPPSASAPAPSPAFTDEDAADTITFENIVLEGEEVTQSAGVMTGQPHGRPRDASAPRQPAGPLARGAAFDDDASGRFIPPSMAEPLSAGEPPVPDLEIEALSAPRLRHRWAWVGGSVLLGLLLAVQAIHHWRVQLVGAPLLGAPLSHLYAALGHPIEPHWNLSAYEVRQQGAESAPGAPQLIRVRFSLANHAMRAQPVPVLRLTLLDRYGKRIAQRDLSPADYWPQGRAPAAFLAADQRIDTEVRVRDPSADSASFELDVCLPDLKGAEHCASDASPGTGGL